MVENTLGRAVSIGTFDGCHLGHREVIRTLRQAALEHNLTPVAITFSRHPLEVVAPHRAPKMLTLPEHREALIRKADCMPMTIDFNEETAATTAADWLRMLRDKHNVRLLVIGYDNTFGCDGLNMEISDYRDIAENLGIEMVEAPVVDGISSSSIRKAIAKGDVREANEMLGYPYALPGVVTHGNALGRELGAPTANLQSDARLIVPAPGVYVAIAILEDSSRHPAVVNIGNRPTLGPNLETTIEVHILDFNKSLYATPLTVEFIDRIRDEKKFHSLSELSQAIADDIAITRDYFSKNPI